MNYLFRLFMLLIMSISFSAPLAAAVAVMDVGGNCGIVAADDEKKPDDAKKPKEGEEEPDCD